MPSAQGPREGIAAQRCSDSPQGIGGIALNREIRTYGENVVFRLKGIRQKLETMDMASANTEPEIIEVMRMLITIIESDYNMEKVRMNPDALQNITTILSMKELQTSVNSLSQDNPDMKPGKDMPPELLY